MYDYAPTLKSQLGTILPTYYELFCDSSTGKPCITYLPQNDSVVAYGDTIGYSEQSYYVKLWTDDKSIVATNASLIDNKMRELGFKRLSYNELSMDNQICAIFLYRGLCKEDFSTTPTPTPEEDEEEDNNNIGE